MDFRDDTVIEYMGDSLSIRYNRKLDYPEVTPINTGAYQVPKIMCVPAERNFLSVVRKAYGITNLPATLHTFAEELRKGQIDLKGKLLQLPISKLKYKYDEDNETSYIVGHNFELDLLESSSGFQSFVPLESTVTPDEIMIYQLGKENGRIERLETYQGLPSDENSLNENIEESNDLFAQLLEIQQSL
ncbi:MAG: hypothetical protein JEZ03_05920 [Bacteroidales bacterium]|nr:hypothetical protein [Bacteroidales bacterium]